MSAQGAGIIGRNICYQESESIAINLFVVPEHPVKNLLTPVSISYANLAHHIIGVARQWLAGVAERVY